MFEKLVTGFVSAVMVLQVTMLALDERFAIFPYVFGLDIRYVLTIGMIGVSTVAGIVRRFFK